MFPIQNLPVLILAYNRYDKFCRCLNSLSKNGIKKIFISIDGPKNEIDKINQKKICQFCLKNTDGLDIKINHLKKNYGCRCAPIKGITWFFNENQYGVVLEDDVLVSKKCLYSFSFLLDKYQSSDEFMSLSSFNEFTNKKIESIYSLPVWRSWGWATWADKWQKHISFSKKIRKYSIWQLYNLLPYSFRSIETAKLVKASQLNLLDAWDYEFNYSHVVNKNNSLTLGGINCLVYGFDNTATHTIDVKSIGINFNLFREREIDNKKIIDYKIRSFISTLNKCGFTYNKKKLFAELVIDFKKYLFYSIILQLRKIKRIMYRRF